MLNEWPCWGLLTLEKGLVVGLTRGGLRVRIEGERMIEGGLGFVVEVFLDGVVSGGIMGFYWDLVFPG